MYVYGGWPFVLVRSGARVPADGVAITGAAEVDESMITGESRPVAKATGDRVVAGTVATDSAGVLAPVGIVLPAAVGAILMSVSTIVVALGAQLLRRVDLRSQRTTAP